MSVTTRPDATLKDLGVLTHCPACMEAISAWMRSKLTGKDTSAEQTTRMFMEAHHRELEAALGRPLDPHQTVLPWPGKLPES